MRDEKDARAAASVEEINDLPRLTVEFRNLRHPGVEEDTTGKCVDSAAELEEVMAHLVGRCTRLTSG